MKSPKSSTGSFKLTGKFTLLLIALIFFLTLTTYAFNEVIRTPQDDNGERKASVIQILMNSLKSSEDERSKLLLINVEQQNDTQKLLASILSAEEARKLPEPERKAREAIVAKAVNSTQALKLGSGGGSNRDNRGYYEEQRAVVVHAEGAAPILAQRQPPYGPPSGQYDSEERPLQPEDERSYEEEEEEQVGEEGDYTNESGQGGGFYQRGPRPYYPDAREQYGQEEEQQQDEGRSTQQRQYDSYYRQWHYATTTATPLVGGNRKLQQQRVGVGNRDPYANYEEDPSEYDYPPSAPARPQQYNNNHEYRPQQVRPQSPTTTTNAQKPRPTSAAQPAEPTYLSVMKSLKTMWDIYQAFSTAWGAIAEHHQKQADQQQQQLKLKRQQLARINSKKPPKFETDEKAPKKNNTNNNTTKATKIKMSTTTITAASDAASSTASSGTTALPPTKNEPRKKAKGDAAARQAADSLRMKRGARGEEEVGEEASTAVAEGRYIKGDPLKGYYDFVITEGSYKFWAVFQVGTALLIIYSTFAAIYYSKVNPLVSDYDYTDYLGGSRSLSGGDLDFVDDGEEGATATASKETAVAPTNWYDWGARTGHSLKFILEAIDKLPGEEHVAYEAGPAAAEEQSVEEMAAQA